jgi:type IV pilus assembly protein PilB
MKAVNKKLGEILIEEKKITEDQLQTALLAQQSSHQRLGHILIDMNYITEDELLAILTQQFGVPAIKLDLKYINPTVTKIIPTTICRKYRLIPYLLDNNVLTVAATDPFNLKFIDEIQYLAGMTVELVLTSEKTVMEAIEQNFGKISTEEPAEGHEIPANELILMPVTRVLETSLQKCVSTSCREMHIEFKDGMMTLIFFSEKTHIDQKKCSLNWYKSFLSHLKVQAHINSEVSNAFLEGLITTNIQDKDHYFRVLIFPTPLCETVTIKRA